MSQKKIFQYKLDSMRFMKEDLILNGNQFKNQKKNGKAGIDMKLITIFKNQPLTVFRFRMINKIKGKNGQIKIEIFLKFHVYSIIEKTFLAKNLWSY